MFRVSHSKDNLTLDIMGLERSQAAHHWTFSGISTYKVNTSKCKVINQIKNMRYTEYIDF